MTEEAVDAWSFQAEPKDAERALALDALGDIVDLISKNTLTSKRTTKEFITAVCEHVLNTPGKMSQAAARRVLEKLNAINRDK